MSYCRRTAEGHKNEADRAPTFRTLLETVLILGEKQESVHSLAWLPAQQSNDIATHDILPIMYGAFASLQH